MRSHVKHIKRRSSLLALAVLFVSLGLLLSVVVQPQIIQQFAQNTTPPGQYGCLHIGESNNSFCATKFGEGEILNALTLHDRPIEDNQLIYYGDRVKGSVQFTAKGDLPITIENISLIAQGRKNYQVQFEPASGNLTLNPGQTTSLGNASHLFLSPEPDGLWDIKPMVIDQNKQSLIPDSDIKKKSVVLSSRCTALRVNELTAQDKKNVQSLCAKEPNNKLCKSKQYCEIFQGKDCKQPNVSEESSGLPCDNSIYLAEKEQEILTDLCRVYPDTDACKDFCARTANSPICPEKFLFVDPATGKAIRFDHPRILYVRDPDNYKFTYAPDYPADAKRFTPGGVQTPAAKPGQPTPAPANKALRQTPLDTNSEDARENALAIANAGFLPEPPPLRPAMISGYEKDDSFFSVHINTPWGCIGNCKTYAEPAYVGVPGCDKNCMYSGKRTPPPPRRSEPMGSQPNDPPMERSRLAPDPAKGRFADPRNPGTSLTDARTAQDGDFGFDSSCGSGRRDQNNRDDGGGIPQHACCANSGALREGCCAASGNGTGPACGVWSQKGKNGELRDGRGNLCTNSPDVVRRDNVCHGKREASIPPNLRGTGPDNPPEGFLPPDPPKPGTPAVGAPIIPGMDGAYPNGVPNGNFCQGDAGCASGFCGPDNKCAIRHPNGVPEGNFCQSGSGCASGFCAENRCQAAPDHNAQRAICERQGAGYNPYENEGAGGCLTRNTNSGSRTPQQREQCQNSRQHEVRACETGCQNDTLIPGTDNICMERCRDIRYDIEVDCR